jgi:protein TonB
MNSFGNCDVAVDACGSGPVANRLRPRWRMRGAASMAQLAIAAILVAVVALAAWWFLGQRGAAPTVAVARLATTAAPGTPAATAPVPAADLTVGQLFKEARAAMGDKRVASPPGNNALEYYLKVLEKQPGDSSATDALRELFPFATDSVQEQINEGNFDEANRVIGLLAKADPSNYTLTILRSKLDAKKKQNDRDQQQLAQKATAAAALIAQKQAPGAGTPTTAEPAAATPAETAAAPAADTTAAAPKPKVAGATPAPSAAPPPTPAAPVGETRDVRVVTPPRPAYPPAAARNRQDGTVEVEFTVAADGSVQNAKVLNSSARVFDDSALSAIKNAKFGPRLENGQPVASTLRRRIDFKLGQ